MREVEVVIDEDGKVSLDLEGFEGQGCSEMADKLAKALGKKASVKKKSEYWKPVIQQKQKVQWGN